MRIRGVNPLFRKAALARPVPSRAALPLVVGVALAALAACGDAESAASSNPASETLASAGSAGGGGGGGAPARIDLDAIFPNEPGRELLLNNCQSCHPWTPVVVLQMNEQEWNRWATEHRTRVPGISDAEFQTLHRYLIKNFNPNTPVPELPPALLEGWTTY